MSTLGWKRSNYVASEGTLEDIDIAKNFVYYLKRNRLPYKPLQDLEPIDRYLDYLFEVMEYYVPEGKYFGTPSDTRNDVFGYFSLPDLRKD